MLRKCKLRRRRTLRRNPDKSMQPEDIPGNYACACGSKVEWLEVQDAIVISCKRSGWTLSDILWRKDYGERENA